LKYTQAGESIKESSRSQVNLTLDCNVSEDGGEEIPVPTSSIIKRPLQRQEKALAPRDSFGSSTALEPAIASTTLFAFSHVLQVRKRNFIETKSLKSSNRAALNFDNILTTFKHITVFNNS